MAGELERRLTTATLTTYGVGVIIGAGIYVLVGKIASIAGNGLWLAFVGAALAALPTGLSYAELASRYPRSAGEAVFVDRAFGRDGLSFLVGFLILASGVASTAAVAHGFTSYLGDLLSLGPHLRPLVIAGFLVVLSLLNHRGIRETTWLNTTLTIASVGGLLVLVLAGLGRWGTVDVWTIAPPEGPPRARPPCSSRAWPWRSMPSSASRTSATWPRRSADRTARSPARSSCRW